MKYRYDVIDLSNVVSKFKALHNKVTMHVDVVEQKPIVSFIEVVIITIILCFVFNYYDYFEMDDDEVERICSFWIFADTRYAFISKLHKSHFPFQHFLRMALIIFSSI